MSNMAINTNILALNSHRSLKGVGARQEKASTRLSSGYRINSAADDAAGLAISEKMRAQIRGLDMASKNSQDAISLIQTAEGGMQEIDNMLQRTRELLVQVSNDTNDQSTDEADKVQGDRQKIQDEINNLMAEIDSMADRVEFNKKKVINGSYSDPVKALEDAQAKLEAATDAKTNATTGTAAKLVTAQENVTAAKDYDKVKKLSDKYDKALEAAKAAAGDPVATAKTTFDNAVAAIRALESSGTPTGTTGYATAHAAALTAIADDLAALSQSAAGTYTTNDVETLLNTHFAGAADSGLFGTDDGIAIAFDNWAAGSEEVTLTVSQGTNTTTDITGDTTIKADIEAIMVAVNAALSAGADWSAATSTFDTTAFDTAFFADSANQIAAGSLGHADNATVAVNDKATLDTALTTATTTATPSGATGPLSVAAANKAVSEAKLNDDKAAFNIQRYDAQVKAAQDLAESKALYFQVGANADQKLELNISSVKTDTLGLGNGKGTENFLNVLKASGSEINHYISALDEALTMVTTERSKLGAAQNRLEYTQKSLDISSENLSSAESRIRDTDMAKEMMNFTQANVLQQAATSMLAQANQSKQGILQLLQ